MKDALVLYGEEAITHYKVLNEFTNEYGTFSVVEFKLETGRTHQIRVHSAYIGHPLLGDGHPLLGDDLYGNKSDLINRQALHSYYLKFIHPMTMKPIEFKIDLPEDMQCILPQK